MNDDYLRALILRYRGGDGAAGQELAGLMAPLVKSLASRMVFKPAELEDYLQVGMIGLLKAIRLYDLGSPVKFATFAASWIKGEMLVYRRSYHLPLKISRSLWEQYSSLHRCRQRLQQLLKREPTVTELARAVGVTPEEVVMIMEASRPLSSLEEALTLPDGAGQEETLVERLSLQEGLMALAPLERQIIMLRFFHELTQAEIGQKLALSQRQVSRLEKRILRRLRQYLQ